MFNLNLEPQLALLVMQMVVLAIMVAASVHDISTQTIPPILFPLLIPIAFFLRVGPFAGQALPYVITAVSVGLIFLTSAMMQKSGGGDVIMMACLGLVLGVEAMTIILLGMLCGIIGTIIINIVKNKTSKVDTVKSVLSRRVPLAPYATLGFGVFLGLIYIV